MIRRAWRARVPARVPRVRIPASPPVKGERKDKIMVKKFAILIAIAVGLGLLSKQVVDAYSLGNQIPTIMLVSALIIVYALVTLLSAVFVGLNKNQYSLIGNSLNSAFLILLPIAFFYLRGSLLWIVSGVLISFIIAAFYLTGQLLTKFKQLFPKRSGQVEKRELNTSVVNFTIISLFNLFLFWGLILMLGLFVTADRVAFFKIAVSWFAAAGLLIPISTQVLFSSVISFKASEDVKRLEKYLNTILRYSSIIIIPMTVGAFFFSELVIGWVYGAEFVEAGLALKLIILGLFFQFISNIFSSALVAYGRINRMAKAYLVNVVFATVLAFAAIPSFGLVGAGACFVVTNVSIALMLILMSGFMKFRILQAVAKPVLVSALMAVLLFHLMPYATSAAAAILIILATIVFYFAVLCVLKGITKSDLRLIRHLK